MRFLSLILCLLALGNGQYAAAQANVRWLQRADYTMDVSLDVKTNRFKGTQRIEYYNNSPDTLTKVFYHLYFNAFQPNSMMDVRSRTIADPDPRVRDRIFNLKEDEIGYQKVISLKQDGKAVQHHTEDTILEVALAQPILPGSKVVFEMEFEAQVPIQIRRSGRDNAEGIRYSMAQWYPKIAEYDYEGWHAHPYIGREFHGVWGNYDVKLTLDASYLVAATGYLQNANEIGYDYNAGGKPNPPKKAKTLTWHFKAPEVHDFAWAADPDFVHETVQVPGGPVLHFFFQNDPAYAQTWKESKPYMVKALQWLNKHYGLYPYEQYSFVQGGDGGMEYAMLTLVTGNRKLGSLVGVMVHELIHSWYQMVLATNESLYAWMDEGFNTYVGNLLMQELFSSQGDPHAGTYGAYFSIVKDRMEEPAIQHADHFITNRAYTIASYVKGGMLLHQLSYVIGQENLDKGMLRYYNEWKFKHPNTTDFKRVMEKVSDLELDWYFDYWINTTHTIDYGVKELKEEGNKTQVTLQRVGLMPMPIDLLVTYTDGSQELLYIPLQIMRGEKPHETPEIPRKVLKDWGWVYPEYVLTIERPKNQIRSVVIDPSQRMADINKGNNQYIAQ